MNPPNWDVICLFGFCLFLTGIGIYSIPVGMVVAGACLVTVSLLAIRNQKRLEGSKE